LVVINLIFRKEYQVNRDQFEGKWKQIRGQIKTKWGKLTDDDLDVIEGQRDELVGRVQELYGKSKEQAEREVADFERTI
jgi:uncharacterized protein YjbJ (UPF0337 family)